MLLYEGLLGKTARSKEREREKIILRRQLERCDFCKQDRREAAEEHAALLEKDVNRNLAP